NIAFVCSAIAFNFLDCVSVWAGPVCSRSMGMNFNNTWFYELIGFFTAHQPTPLNYAGLVYHNGGLAR
ncbi:hypothetical protein LXA12_17575, partial [Erwinia amylovora]|uniref:hypothetical protein n=1 Tax=Erwinia amylovora TaxID=552 RepID=UPI0020BD527B